MSFNPIGLDQIDEVGEFTGTQMRLSRFRRNHDREAFNDRKNFFTAVSDFEDGLASDCAHLACNMNVFATTKKGFIDMHPEYESEEVSHTFSNGLGVLFCTTTAQHERIHWQYEKDVFNQSAKTLFLNECIRGQHVFGLYMDLDPISMEPLSNNKIHRMVLAIQQAVKHFYEPSNPEDTFSINVLKRKPKKVEFKHPEDASKHTFTNPNTGKEQDHLFKDGIHINLPKIDVTHEQAACINATALETCKTVIKRQWPENPLDEVFDIRVYANGLRMPFSCKPIPCPTCAPDREQARKNTDDSEAVYNRVWKEERMKGTSYQEAGRKATKAKRETLNELEKRSSHTGRNRRTEGCSDPRCFKGSIPDNNPYTVWMCIRGDGVKDDQKTALLRSNVKRTLEECVIRRPGKKKSSPTFLRYSGCPVISDADFNAVMSASPLNNVSVTTEKALTKPHIPHPLETGLKTNNRALWSKPGVKIKIDPNDTLRMNVLRGLLMRYGDGDERFYLCRVKNAVYKISPATQKHPLKYYLHMDVEGRGAGRCMNLFPGHTHKSCRVYFIITKRMMVQKCWNGHFRSNRKNGPCNYWSGGPPLPLNSEEESILFDDISKFIASEPKLHTENGNPTIQPTTPTASTATNSGATESVSMKSKYVQEQKHVISQSFKRPSVPKTIYQPTLVPAHSSPPTNTQRHQQGAKSNTPRSFSSSSSFNQEFEDDIKGKNSDPSRLAQRMFGTAIHNSTTGPITSHIEQMGYNGVLKAIRKSRGDSMDEPIYPTFSQTGRSTSWETEVGRKSSSEQNSNLRERIQSQDSEHSNSANPKRFRLAPPRKREADVITPEAKRARKATPRKPFVN